MPIPNRYFDNAATSYPKPKEVGEAVKHHIEQMGGTYGRAAYARVQQTTFTVESCRDRVTEVIDGENGYVAWSANATDAINKLLRGLRRTVSRVLVSPMEHNAVMRPLDGLAYQWDIMPHNSDGRINLEELSKIDTSKYQLAIVNHQSNVNGVVQPISQIKEILKDVALLVDCSQSIGERDIRTNSWGIDYAVFTAHKGIMGITGLGWFYAKDISSIELSDFGGTGSNSESFNMPNTFPDRFQAGTPNIVGIIALEAAIQSHPKSNHSFEDFVRLINELKAIESLQILTGNNYNDPSRQGELFSITSNRLSTSQIAQALFDKYGIECRSGLHCAPLAHQTLGTTSGGSVRFSLSPYHTTKDLDYLCSAIIAICKF